MNDYLSTGNGPIAIGSGANSGSRIVFPGETYVSPLLDLTQPISNIELVPGKANHIPNRIVPNWVIERVAGTQTTAMVNRAGSDSGHTNFMSQASAPSNGDVNSGTAVPYIASSGANSQTGVQIPGQPVFLDIVSGAIGTGGFVLVGRLYVFVTWLAVS